MLADHSNPQAAAVKNTLVQLRQDAGTQLDPHVVDVLIAVVTDQDTRVTVRSGA